MDSDKFSVRLAFESGRCSTVITVKSSDTVGQLLSRLRSSDRGDSSTATSTEHATFQTVREGQLELATYDADPELMMSTLAEEERDSGITMARGSVALLNLHHSELTGCVTHVSVNSLGRIGKVKPKRGETVLQVYRRLRSIVEAAKHAVRVDVERKIKNARAPLSDDDDYYRLDGPLQGTESTTVLLSRHAQSRVVARKVPFSDAVRAALSPGHPMACGCIKRVISTDKGRLVAVTSHRPDRRRGPFVLTLYYMQQKQRPHQRSDGDQQRLRKGLQIGTVLDAQVIPKPSFAMKPGAWVTLGTANECYGIAPLVARDAFYPNGTRLRVRVSNRYKHKDGGRINLVVVPVEV